MENNNKIKQAKQLLAEVYEYNEVKKELKNFYKYVEKLDNSVARLVNEMGIPNEEPILKEFDELVGELQSIKQSLKEKYVNPFENKKS